MKAGETGLEGPPVFRPGEVSEKKLYNTNIEDDAWCLEHIIFKMYQYNVNCELLVPDSNLFHFLSGKPFTGFTYHFSL